MSYFINGFHCSYFFLLFSYDFILEYVIIISRQVHFMFILKLNFVYAVDENHLEVHYFYEVVIYEFLQAKYVIMSVPVPLQNRIVYEPPLPANRNQLIHRMPMGSVIKTFMYYDSPFWRKDGTTFKFEI